MDSDQAEEIIILLKEILEEMKSLLAWQKLKSHEARERPSLVIRFSNNAGNDLMDR